ncbi:hypothetical protein ACTHGU_03275 [Chitinophagaceae bacterium MMS25-I14]
MAAIQWKDVEMMEMATRIFTNTTILCQVKSNTFVSRRMLANSSAICVMLAETNKVSSRKKFVQYMSHILNRLNKNISWLTLFREIAEIPAQCYSCIQRDCHVLRDTISSIIRMHRSATQRLACVYA